jgi:hypothetical protein
LKRGFIDAGIVAVTSRWLEVTAKPPSICLTEKVLPVLDAVVVADQHAGWHNARRDRSSREKGVADFWRLRYLKAHVFLMIRAQAPAGSESGNLEFIAP